LATTNAVESLISRTWLVKRNVKRWRGEQIMLRWVAAGILKAVKTSGAEGVCGHADAGQRCARARSSARCLLLQERIGKSRSRQLGRR